MFRQLQAVMIALIFILSSCNEDKKPHCGDGVINTDDEYCDGEDLGGNFCGSLQLFEGDLGLRCDENCQFDTSGCSLSWGYCGDGAIDRTQDEECDKWNFNDKDCRYYGFLEGELKCTDSCRIDRSDCHTPVPCGNGTIDGTEQCDNHDFNGATCESFGYYGGNLQCTYDCRYNFDFCEPAGICGDGEVNIAEGEECETGELRGATCESLGYYGGELSCAEDCTYDLAECLMYGSCGDGTIQPSSGEDCDGTNIGVATCASLGYSGDVLTCSPSCRFDVSECAFCGDGVISSGEDCDGTNIGVATCASLGYSGDVLTCSPSCRFDVSGCTSCGDGVISSGEDCDGTNVGTDSCFSLGYMTGVLSCDASCVIDTSGCSNAIEFGTSGDDMSYASTSDASGNIYVAGYTSGSFSGYTNAGSLDAFLVKYHSDGSTIYEKQWGSSGDDRVLGMVMDSSNYIYLTGYTTGNLEGNTNLGSSDIFVTKLDLGGNRLWTTTWGTSSVDRGQAITADGFGNLYVTGYTRGDLQGETNSGTYDIFVSKLDPGGTLVWTKVFGTSSDNFGWGDRGNGIIWLNNYLYITGVTEGNLEGQTNHGSVDGFITKMSSAGSRIWTKEWGTSQIDYLYSITTDGTDLYIAGHSYGSISGYTNHGDSDLVLLKYTVSGLRDWERMWGSDTYDELNVGNSLIVFNGNVYITGLTEGGIDTNTNSGSDDIFLTKYSLAGVYTFTRQWGTSSSDDGNSVIVDSSGNIIIQGITEGQLENATNQGLSDIFLLKTTP